MKAEWRNRAAFAEAAEAIGTETGFIMSQLNMDDGTTRVLWSDGPDIYVGVLDRDSDHVLHLLSKKHIATMHQFQMKVQEILDDFLEEHDE